MLQCFPDPNKPLGSSTMQSSGRWIRWRKQPWSTEKGCVRSPLHLDFTAQVLDTVSFYLRSDLSLPPCLREQYCDHASPSACLGRHIAHALCYSPDRLLVASKFPNDGCFSCLQGFPTAATLAEGRGYWVSERTEWTDRCSEIARSRRCVGRGAWGVGLFEALAHSRQASAEEAVVLEPPRRALRCSENLPIEPLPCQLGNRWLTVARRACKPLSFCVA